MQIVSGGDNLHEISKSVSKCFKMSSLKFYPEFQALTNISLTFILFVYI